MTADTVIVHPDHDTLAAAVASRLITAILDSQARRGSAHVALTGVASERPRWPRCWPTRPIGRWTGAWWTSGGPTAVRARRRRRP